ncbi:MAG: DUF1501 domain-containing protein [Planctomycetia bacterium]|nr:DUF1501 domain-containing protein [Planctomycetia bacterium]
MLSVGSFNARDCQGVTRRAFVRAAAAVPFAWGLAGRAAQAVETEPKARSVLLVWLGGGPSHVDLFDPKPKAPLEYRGPFASIATATPGVRFTELLPKLAARSRRFSLIRSNVNFDGNHRPAGSISLTGAVAGAAGYPPNFGSIISRVRGASALPAFVSLARGRIGDGDGPVLGSGGGTWGTGHDPFMVDCSDAGAVDLPDLKLLEGLSPQRLADRQTVLRDLDRARRQLDEVPLTRWTALYERAHSLLGDSGARQAFDLSREPEAAREAYGHTSFGQSCLLGRRLVEAGVPYVQVNWSQYVEVFYPFSDYGWDTHADNFGLLADWHGPLLDGVFSTLLDDLEARGLLKTTLVVCMGEFGRTPRINAIGSRDHWHQCYFSMWAGAGVQPGRAIGESDPRGEFPATEPVTPAMVGTTILELAGVSSAERARLKVLEGGRVIDALL